jgi:transcriptional regulator with XRE-family HTH domain
MTEAAATVGDLVRSWREQRKLSQLALAADAEISQKHLSFIESGRSSAGSNKEAAMQQKLYTNPALVFDPRGIVDQRDRPIAPRKRTLKGLRFGILDNSKWNANKLLRGASEALGKDSTFVGINYYVKPSFSKDAPPELIEQIAAENDIVLMAIGDCGSCCSSCIRDGVALEELGIPSAPVITTEFVKETELTKQALGMLGLQPVVIDHPVSSITQNEIVARVAYSFERC